MKKFLLWVYGLSGGLIVLSLVVAGGRAMFGGDDGDDQPAWRVPGMTVTPTGWSSGNASKMRTAAGNEFWQAIKRNVERQDAGSLRIACDAAQARLAKSRNNDEIKDWIDLAEACNAGLAGDWSKAYARLP